MYHVITIIKIIDMFQPLLGSCFSIDLQPRRTLVVGEAVERPRRFLYTSLTENAAPTPAVRALFPRNIAFLLHFTAIPKRPPRSLNASAGALRVLEAAFHHFRAFDLLRYSLASSVSPIASQHLARSQYTPVRFSAYADASSA